MEPHFTVQARGFLTPRQLVRKVRSALPEPGRVVVSLLRCAQIIEEHCFTLFTQLALPMSTRLLGACPSRKKCCSQRSDRADGYTSQREKRGNEHSPVHYDIISTMLCTRKPAPQTTLIWVAASLRHVSSSDAERRLRCCRYRQSAVLMDLFTPCPAGSFRQCPAGALVPQRRPRDDLPAIRVARS